MAFLRRFKEIKRFCAIYHGHFETKQLLYYRSLLPVSNRLSFDVHSTQFEASRIVRFYAAAPSEGNQKKEERDSREPTLNEQITAPSVRLVTNEGHFLVSRFEALSRAKSLMLDLVLVDAQAKPPVCKIFDYKKEKYLQQMKEKERAKNKQSALKKGPPKEIRFSGKITQKDLQIKADMSKRLMESGHRVKCTAIEPTDSSDMETMLSRFSALIEDVAFVESGPRVEKKQAFVVVRHVKFGAPKKGSSKKASKTATQNEDSEELTDEDAPQANESEAALFNRGEEIHTVFDSPPITTASSSPVRSPPSKPETENRYAKAPPKTDMENRYVKPPPRPDIGNRYPQAPPRPETENGYSSNRYAGVNMGNRYAQAPPRPVTENGYSSNRYTRAPPRPETENGYSNRYARAQTPNQRPPAADVSVHDRSRAEVTNRYVRNSPPRDPGSGGVPPFCNFPRRPTGAFGSDGSSSQTLTESQRR